MSETENANPFAPRLTLVLISAGVVLGLAFLLLSGFRTELSHSLDQPPPGDARSGDGFYAIRRLIDIMPEGKSFSVEREADLGASALLILTPEADTRAEDVEHVLMARTNGQRPTLIILPKWEVRHPPLTRNRAERTGLVSLSALGAMLPIKNLRVGRAPAQPVFADTRFLRQSPPEPRVVIQTISGDSLVPLILTRDRGALLARVAGSAVYILADPDLMNNQALKSEAGARAALHIIAALNPDDPGYVGFDTTLHYRPGERNLIKLMFTPPFLAVTIAMLFAALLAVLATAVRFGPVLREGRAVAPGKRALADNIAALTRLAGKTHRAGVAYADWVRDWTAARLHAPGGLPPAERAAFLDRQGKADGDRFTDLAARAAGARTDAALLDAARDLDSWRREMTE
ncbi:hypothetical protein KY084_05370 [Stakelama sp. CBK3Z-3]|uniref:DUF4350 domain-containing protein n=1 Tax=Stakelama flava TaxID=2860338 RepID=A0ABS6XLN2_9SPHN|nr:hypothetical protein [Stakelama flava]MBW4330301.1 hypothetical protein [Stakelama flava]